MERLPDAIDESANENARAASENQSSPRDFDAGLTAPLNANPSRKKRRRKRKNHAARLFAFTITALFLGLIAGYYIGNSHSLDGLFANRQNAPATNENAENVAPPIVTESPAPTPFVTPVSQPTAQPSPQPTPNAGNENPFDEYNRRTASSPPDPSFDPMPAASGLIIPVAGITRENLVDTFTASRSEGRAHNALDIMAPRGTPVLATTDGRLMRFFESDKGGLTIYQMSVDERTVFYYAHLDRYADNLQTGQMLKCGETIGYVGDTGNSGAGNYHLHFAIWRVTDPKRYWDGENVNPYPLLVK